MKVLILGGTKFIGRHLVQTIQSLHPSWDITLLHRGQTGNDLFPNIKRIYADRESADLIHNPSIKQDWDGIIDLSAYFPRSLNQLIESLNGRVGRYVFCSTVSVYQDLFSANPALPLNEDSPKLVCTSENEIDPSPVTYGSRKSKCEDVVIQSGIDYCVIRPSLVYGAYDPTDRFAYWIYKADKNKPFILPEGGLNLVQKTYAPDLAKAFVAALIKPEAKYRIYHIADWGAYTWLDTIRILDAHLGKQSLSKAVLASTADLEQNGIKPWADIPLWMPRSHLLLDTYRSRSELEFKSNDLKSSITTTADWFLSQNRRPTAGISDEQELKIISSLSLSSINRNS